MACLVKNCSIKGDDERMLVCWLCHECCHFKCSGLSGLVAEAIPKHKGLQWCCEGCSKMGVTYYRFFQNTKEKFLKLQEDAAKLNKDIAAYGKLFDDFKSLDNLKSPPKSSSKRRKSPRNLDKEKCDELPNVIITSCTSAPVSATDVNANNADLHVNNADADLNIVSDDDNPTHAVTNVAVNNPLVAIPPNKTIFVSRLANATTIDDVKFYINNKIGRDVVISILKYNSPQPRSISSFKITVSAVDYSTLLNPKFWPDHTLVREFVYRPNTRNVGVLPQRESSAPKN